MKKTFAAIVLSLVFLSAPSLVSADYSQISFVSWAPYEASSANTSDSFSYYSTGTDSFLTCESVVYSNPGTVTMSYGGSGMTEIGTQRTPSGAWVDVFYLASPVSGTNTLAVSSTNSVYHNIVCASYAGVDQISPIDTNISQANQNGVAAYIGTISQSVTTVANGDWTIQFLGSGNGRTFGATIGSARCINCGHPDDTGSLAALEDSNGPVTPAGNSTLAFHNGNASTDNVGVTMFAIKPAQQISFVSWSPYEASSASTSDAFSYNSTGVNPFLVCESIVYANPGTVSMSYAGNSMTQIGSQQNPSGGWVDVFYLPAPTNGTNTLAVSSTNSVYHNVVCASYAGVAQTNPIGSSVAQTSVSGVLNTTTVSQSISTANKGDWLIQLLGSGSGRTYTGNNGTTRCTNCGYPDDSGTLAAFQDSNGPVPIGSNSLTLSNWTGSSDNAAATMFSIKQR